LGHIPLYMCKVQSSTVTLLGLQLYLLFPNPCALLHHTPWCMTEPPSASSLVPLRPCQPSVAVAPDKEGRGWRALEWANVRKQSQAPFPLKPLGAQAAHERPAERVRDERAASSSGSHTCARKSAAETCEGCPQYRTPPRQPQDDWGRSRRDWVLGGAWEPAPDPSSLDAARWRHSRFAHFRTNYDRMKREGATRPSLELRSVDLK